MEASQRLFSGTGFLAPKIDFLTYLEARYGQGQLLPNSLVTNLELHFFAIVRRCADRLESDEDRRQFLEAIPLNRQILGSEGES